MERRGGHYGYITSTIPVNRSSVSNSSLLILLTLIRIVHIPSFVHTFHSCFPLLLGMHRSTILGIFTSVASAAPYHPSNTYSQTTNSCAIIFDGRIPANASLADFDTASGGGWNPFNPDYVKGNDLAWSDILLLPKPASPSRFDGATSSIPVEVTISDASIFQKQNGFRRAGLQFSKDNNEDSPGSEGVVTLHFSVLQDKSRPLNLTHEYLV